MLRKILAVVLLVASMSAFLVVFGGFALIDISIKLMWLSFSTIVAFAASSLGVNLSQNLVNKLLAKQKLLPGRLLVTESPIINKDKIILCNLLWLDEQGVEKLTIHQVELRTTLMALFLASCHHNRWERILGELKEIVLQQPQVNLAYQLKDPQQLRKNLQTTSPLDWESNGMGLKLPKQLKLYIERGTANLILNGQKLRLENIHGILRNEPVAYHYLSCQLDDENITLQNQNGVERYLLRANKLPLKQFWPLLYDYVQLDKLDFIDGELSDCKAVLEWKQERWSCSAISWNISDLSINSNGLLLEDINGKFSSLDLKLFQIKKLDFTIANHALRLNGNINLLPPGEKGCIYKLRLRSDKLFLKNDIDVNIFDGFLLQGLLRQEEKHLLAGVEINGQVRLDLPHRKPLKISHFKGTMDLFEGLLTTKASTCYVNDKLFSLEDSQLDLTSEDFLIHARGEGHEISLLLDKPLQGSAFFNITLEGNLKDARLRAYGIYQLADFTYKFKFLPSTPKANLNGRVSYEGGLLRLTDNHINIAGHSIPLLFDIHPCQQEGDQGYTLNLQEQLSNFKSTILRSLNFSSKEEKKAEVQEQPQLPPPPGSYYPAPPNTEHSAAEGGLLDKLKEHLPFFKK